MRRLLLFLLAIAVLEPCAPAQSLSAQGSPSRADCEATAKAGEPLPPECKRMAAEAVALHQQEQPESLPVQPPQLTSTPNEGAPAVAVAPPQNPSDRGTAPPPAKPQTEFEQLVADTVGRPLPLFGQSLFRQPPSTFAPTVHAQVPDDYRIGAGDELQIRIWGQLHADLRVVVDRSGQIYIPRVGPVGVAGIRYSQLNQRLKEAVRKLYRNFELSVAIGRIRSIQVYVVGQARSPGAYTISSLSTLVNAVFASGGPTPAGSLRNVQLQREGSTIAHFDLYELLVRGDKSHDVALQSGDVIYYPPVGPLAAVAGSVRAPAIYEMLPGASLDELIETAGGLSSVADSSKVTVERIAQKGAASAGERNVLEFPLDKQARALQLHDGDIVRVFSIVPSFANTVTLRGQVANPGRYPWKPGMRIRDLIPNAQSLLTRSYWLGRDELTDGRSTEYPIGGASAGKARSRQQNSNVGSLTSDLHRASPEINWSYAIVQRVDPVDLSTRLLSFDLGKAVLEGDEANNLELQPNDVVTIFSQEDIAVPQRLRTLYVRLEGEVRRPGVYKVSEGELLRHVIRRAGGLTPQAYLYGTVMTRESARRQQQKSLDKLTRTLEIEMQQAAVAAAGRSSQEDAQLIAARQAAQQSLIAELRNTKATGRVVLNLRSSDNTIQALPPIAVEDNDRIVIPHLPATVTVTGMVYNPGSFVYSPRHSVGDYLKLAGTGRRNADMHHAFVLRADGSVVARRAVNGLFVGNRFDRMRLNPGDRIVVPSKIATGSFVRGLRDWTQISSQLALTGAALAVIH